MKSYKCEYCNLTNWMDAVVCKRCQTPNPYSQEYQEYNGSNDSYDQNQHMPQYDEQAQFQVNEGYENQQPPNHYQAANRDAPPPPNVYGQRSGNSNDNYYDSNNQTLPHGLYQQNSTLSSAEIDEFETAKKQIKGAWKAGIVWFSLLGLITGGVVLFGAAIGKPEGAVDLSGLVLILGVVFAVMTGLIALLTFGVYKKSQACAVILTILMSLGVLNNLLSMESLGRGIVAILFGILFVYYFANGIRGISTYKRLVSRFPNLKY